MFVTPGEQCFTETEDSPGLLKRKQQDGLQLPAPVDGGDGQKIANCNFPKK